MEEGIHSCELEKGSFLGENDDGDVDGRPVESLMDYQEILNQHVRMMSEASNKTIGSYVFKTNYGCVFVGKEIQEYVMKKEETTLSHEGDQDHDHFQQSCVELERQEQEPIITVNHTEMDHEDNLEDEEIEGQHLDVVLMDYVEELRLLEE